MPPVIFESRDVIGGGRYLQEVRISNFFPRPELPGGIRYSLCLVDLASGEVILLYDIHRGKPHHRHLRGRRLLTVSWTRTRCSMTSFATWASFWRASYERTAP